MEALAKEIQSRFNHKVMRLEVDAFSIDAGPRSRNGVFGEYFAQVIDSETEEYKTFSVKFAGIDVHRAMDLVHMFEDLQEEGFNGFGLRASMSAKFTKAELKSIGDSLWHKLFNMYHI